ncbi:MAG: ribonuclease III [Candidatus Gracilibacteria bacterium]|nr:ribonuclease III [Candidatus Gracilibacteria bacterium]
MNNLKELEKKLGLKFKDENTLKSAFIHKSFINEHKDFGLSHNERLEFLGDAVLELVSTRHLYEKYPDQDEGKMTAFRSALVQGKHLAEVSRELNLGKYLLLSHGEEKSGGREKNYILANLLEALIGSIYLDLGYEYAEKFIKDHILAHLDTIINEGQHIDAKSKFQEIAQEKENTTPHYELLEESGPDHDKVFKMGVFLGDKKVAEGIGSSKQKAELNAAENALKEKSWN